MIYVHRLNNEKFLLNCELIEFVEETPNTVVSMVSGRKLIVSESCSKMKKLIIDYRKKIHGTNQINKK